MAIITLSQIQDFKQLTSNITEAKQLTPYIDEAQEFDLRSFLGDELYIDLVADYEASPSLETYSDLYNGSTYTYSGKTYKHEGIVPVLVYYAYSRYLANSSVHSTKYGMVQKTNEFSQPASEKTLSRLIAQAKSGAFVYQNRVKLFLSHNASSYPLWYGSKKRTGALRISPIGGNSTQKSKYPTTNECCSECGCINCQCVC
jgi:hypothetical protein